MINDQKHMGISSQKTNIPRLQTGEQIILQSQGAYKNNFRSGWKVAQCILTNQRLIMYQRPTIRFQIPIDHIRSLAVERLHYVLRKRECLSISYNVREGSEEGRSWFVVNDLEKWRERIISQTSLLMVNIETIQNIAAQLGADGRDILLYLWENRYARIDQLAELIEAPSHMHVLMEIRETINPVAEKIVGIPILSFERSKVDPETGEKVLFSWWLMGKQEEWAKSEDQLLDIFDEGSHIQVIMEVRGIEASDLRLEVERDQLTVRSEKIGSTWKEIIHLPTDVVPDNYQMHLKNNLLKIILSKVQSLESDQLKTSDLCQ